MPSQDIKFPAVDNNVVRVTLALLLAPEVMSYNRCYECGNILYFI